MLQPWKYYVQKEKMLMKAKVTSYGTINDVMVALNRKMTNP